MSLCSFEVAIFPPKADSINSPDFQTWFLPFLAFYRLSVQTKHLVETKALQCGISVLNIMTLWGSSSSYGGRLFLVGSHMKCHLEFDKIWRSNPLWELHWTAHFLILFSCYNQALTADPCHCVIKLIICHKNYCGLRSLEVRITGSLLIILNWLFCVTGQ